MKRSTQGATNRLAIVLMQLSARLTQYYARSDTWDVITMLLNLQRTSLHMRNFSHYVV